MLRICIISGLGWPSPTLTSPHLTSSGWMTETWWWEERMETSEITISWECWPAAGKPPLGYIHYIYWDIGGREPGRGMIRGEYLLLTLSWHSETSNCESKYSLHQENLPIMMGAGHYCDQLSHRSGKWDVINVAVNNNIRIYCGKITTAIEVKLDIKSCR